MLIADIKSEGKQIYVAYVHRAKTEEANAKGTWDAQLCEGYWSDELYKSIEKVSKPTIVHQLLMLAMKLVKMLLDKNSNKK